MTEKCEVNRCENPAAGPIEDDEGSFSFCDDHFDKVTSAALHEKLSLADAVDAVALAENIGNARHFPHSLRELGRARDHAVKQSTMSTVYEPNLCPQCRSHSAKFEHHRRTGGYEIACGCCGRRECHHPKRDEEGSYCGFQHEVWQGAGVLFFRHAGEHFFRRHLLNTPGEVIAADRWLRERLSAGAVDPETACLTCWDDQTQCVEVVVGELLDILAGSVKTVSGFPDVAKQVR
jgi:hypothetical protein